MLNHATDADMWEPMLVQEAAEERIEEREQYSEELCQQIADRRRELLNKWSMEETGDPYLPDEDEDADELEGER